MNNDERYNPYKDATIHQTTKNEPAHDIQRGGFNDVLRHADIVNGHQIPKQLDQYPRRLRKVMRWGIWIYVLIFGGGITYSVIKILLVGW